MSADLNANFKLLPNLVGEDSDKESSNRSPDLYQLATQLKVNINFLTCFFLQTFSVTALIIARACRGGKNTIEAILNKTLPIKRGLTTTEGLYWR